MCVIVSAFECCGHGTCLAYVGALLYYDLQWVGHRFRMGINANASLSDLLILLLTPYSLLLLSELVRLLLSMFGRTNRHVHVMQHVQVCEFGGASWIRSFAISICVHRRAERD